MKKEHIEEHLKAIEQYINDSQAKAQQAYNRLKLLQGFLGMPDDEFRYLEENTIPVKVDEFGFVNGMRPDGQ